MKNQKGQALVEFVLILPVLIFFILGIFDVGNLMYQKYQLASDLDVVADLYQNKKTEELNRYVNEQNIAFKTTKNNDLITLILSKKMTIKTPGLNFVFDDFIEVKEIIYEK